MLDDKLRELEDAAREIRTAAFEKMRDDRLQRIQALLGLVERPEDNQVDGARVLALRLLGEYRAAEAVVVLVRYLDFLPLGIVAEERIATEFYYPSVWALCQVGYPVFPQLLEEVATATDAERRKLAAWILYRVEGRNYAVTRLQDTAAERGGEAAERLQEAAEYLRGYQQTFHVPEARQ
jgi:hypothetical protein